MTMLIKTFVTPPSNLQMPGLLVEKLSAGSHPYILITLYPYNQKVTHKASPFGGKAL